MVHDFFLRNMLDLLWLNYAEKVVMSENAVHEVSWASAMRRENYHIIYIKFGYLIID